MVINPWGIVVGASGSWWTNENGTGVSQLHDGAGNSTVALPFVTVPPPTGGTAPSSPTGIVVQNNVAHPNDFVVSKGSASGPSVFIFVTEDGTISGWNPGVDRTNGILEVDESAQGDVFKGLALLAVPSGSTLPQGQ
jgi:hypothetical protein